eukprot:6184653-Pleurochrysis_carterae.AAC.3
MPCDAAVRSVTLARVWRRQPRMNGTNYARIRPFSRLPLARAHCGLGSRGERSCTVSRPQASQRQPPRLRHWAQGCDLRSRQRFHMVYSPTRMKPRKRARHRRGH